MTPSLQQLLGGVAADLCFGDPRWLPHPVSGIAHIASALERVLRRSRLPLRAAGTVVWALVVIICSGTVWWSCRLLPQPWIGIYWIYSLLAMRSLDQHALAVRDALRHQDLAAARKAVAMIVGRQTAQLDEREITRATIETVAENMNDGVIAPLFWLGVAGPPGMAAYKAINTMDSMFGYRNEKYRDFGWCPARMDDAASWLPARLTAVIIWIVAAIVPGMSAQASVRCTLRDAHLQPSPNSGYPEAAVAGALGVRLGGINEYGGTISTKHFLGDDLRPLVWQTYREMRTLLYGGTLVATLLLAGITAWR